MTERTARVARRRSRPSRSEDIAADYELSDGRMAEEERAVYARTLREASTTAREVVARTVEALDVVAHLGKGGLDDATIGAARDRLLVASDR